MPKTYYKHWDPEKEEYVYLPEGEIPKGDMTSKTGDNSLAALWGGLCLLSALGMGLLVLIYKKKES